MAARWNIILALTLISFNYCCCNTFPVPLLIWSSKSLDVEDQILAGHTLGYEDVQDKYLDKLNVQSNTICVFVQDKLSIDDFAVPQSEHLKNLKQVLSSSSTSIVLPSVTLLSEFDQDNNRLVKYFEKNSLGKVLSLTAKDVPTFSNKINDLKKDGPNTIIVHLQKLQNEKGSRDSDLMASDEIIGKMTDELWKVFPDYIGLLTANMPRDDVMLGMEQNRELSSHARFRRDAQSSDTPIPCDQHGILVKSDVMLSFSNITVKYGNDSDALKPNTSVVIQTAVVKNLTNEGRKLSFTFDYFINGSKIDLSMTFNRTGLGWKCLVIDIGGKLKGKDIDVSFDCSDVYTPTNKSYACQNQPTFKRNDSDVTFEGFQVQPYSVNNRRFSNSYNCIGFFTAPIWMGLLSVGVLVAILYGGVLSLLSIKCMDRFDNPKDPTITINSES